jgi:hypothetical protein
VVGEGDVDDDTAHLLDAADVSVGASVLVGHSSLLFLPSLWL